MEIGTRIKGLREAQGKSSFELAYEAGVHPDTIDRYEAGKVPEAIDRLRRIAGALGVPLSVLVVHDEIDGTTEAGAGGSSPTPRTSSSKTKAARPLAARR